MNIIPIRIEDESPRSIEAGITLEGCPALQGQLHRKREKFGIKAIYSKIMSIVANSLNACSGLITIWRRI